MSTGPLNSGKPTTAEVVGAVYNATQPAPSDKQAMALQVDNEGNLLVSVAVGGGGSSGITKIEDTSGNALNSNGSGALNVAVVSGGGSNPSVGTTGSPAPSSATEIGTIDGSGNLQGASASNPVPVSAAALPLPANAAKETGGNLAILAGAVSSGIGQENIAQWAGTGVSAPPASGVPAAGTEVAPVIKTLLRKSTSILTTTALTANQVFTSAWFDTQPTGDVEVICSWVSTGAGQALTVEIQETDDTANAGMEHRAGYWPASTYSWVLAQIRCRYWRVVFTCNGSNMTTFELSATASSTANVVQIQGTTAQGAASAIALSGGGDIVIEPVVGAGTDAAIVARGWLANDNATSVAIGVTNFNVKDGSSNSLMAVRNPTTFKTVQATASGNTALWTPTSGKKFRLMRLIIDFTANVSQSAGGVITLTFQDSTTGLPISFDVFVPTAAVTTTQGGYTSGWIDLGNGILSAAANNVLNVNLSAALATGNARVTACGTEE